MKEEEVYTLEDCLRAVEDHGTQLTELFEREARQCLGSDDRSIGRREAYEACALATIKATTRKILINGQTMVPHIQFKIPLEAKP